MLWLKPDAQEVEQQATVSAADISQAKPFQIGRGVATEPGEHQNQLPLPFLRAPQHFRAQDAIEVRRWATLVALTDGLEFAFSGSGHVMAILDGAAPQSRFRISLK